MEFARAKSAPVRWNRWENAEGLRLSLKFLPQPYPPPGDPAEKRLPAGWGGQPSPSPPRDPGPGEPL